MQNINGKIQGAGRKPLSFLLVALCAFCMAMATSVARAETWVWTGAAEEAEPQWFTAAENVNARNADGKWLIATNVSGEGSFVLDEENKPAWVEGVSLEGGNLYLNVKTCGLTLSVR